MPTTVTRNGKTYDAGDVTVAMLAYEEDEVVELTYGVEQDHTLNYCLANEANSYSMGKVKPTASITLMLTAVRRLEKIAAAANAGNTSLLKLKPFPIVVTLFNDDQEEFTDTIMAKFMSQGRTISGTDGLKQQFELFATSVVMGQV